MDKFPTHSWFLRVWCWESAEPLPKQSLSSYGFRYVSAQIFVAKNCAFFSPSEEAFGAKPRVTDNATGMTAEQKGQI